MVRATTRNRPYGQIPSDVFRDNYAFCIDHDTHVCIDHDTHVRASLRGAKPYFIGQIPSDVFPNNYELRIMIF